MFYARIIKSENCLRCKTYLPRLDKANFQYVIYNGDDLKNTEELDKWGISDFPVVQIIDYNHNVMYQFPHGTWSPSAINHKIQELSKIEQSKIQKAKEKLDDN